MRRQLKCGAAVIDALESAEHQFMSMVPEVPAVAAIPELAADPPVADVPMLMPRPLAFER